VTGLAPVMPPRVYLLRKRSNNIVNSLVQWLKTNSVMLVNAGSLIGTTAITSGLGFVYWWIAARHFSPEAIGIASASISAMMLLGSICVLGLGTLLITELPRQPGQEASLISTALIVVSGAGAIVGIVFALIAPSFIMGFHPLRADGMNVLIFAVGVSLNAVTLVLDQALIGILRGGLQLWRNTLFALIKLVTLFLVGTWLSNDIGVAIYATWAISNVVSILVLVVPIVLKKGITKEYLPQWGLLHKLGIAAAQHHLLNLTLQFPTQVLPIVVTALLSAQMNAWFYVSWMLVSFVFIIPGALTTVLHAMNAAQSSSLAHKARVTMGLAVLTAILTNVVLQFGAQQVLSLFGSSYAENAAWCLRILALAAFPLIIKNHYISICRIQDRVGGAMLSILPGGILEVVAAMIGAHLGGLSGLSFGWVVAIAIEAVFMFSTVYKAIWSSEASSVSDTQSSQEIQAIWLVETVSMPSIALSYPGIKALQHIENISSSGILSPGPEYHKPVRLKPPRLQKYVQDGIATTTNDIDTSIGA